jgi:hypothetical protein
LIPKEMNTRSSGKSETDEEMNTRNSTAEKKKQWCEKYASSPLTMQDFCDLHGGKFHTFKGWWSDYKELITRGIDLFHDAGGRPSAVDTQGCDELVTDIEQTNIAQKSMSVKQFGALVNEKATLRMQYMTKF